MAVIIIGFGLGILGGVGLGAFGNDNKWLSLLSTLILLTGWALILIGADNIREKAIEDYINGDIQIEVIESKQIKIKES